MLWVRKEIEATLNVVNMVAGARRAKTSSTISRVYSLKKTKISSEKQLCSRKCLIDVRGQRSEYADRLETKETTKSNNHWFQQRYGF